jgi:signal transduction histidine kinase
MLDALVLTLPLLITSIMCFYLAALVFVRSAQLMKRSFIILLLAIGSLSAFYSIEINETVESIKLFWNDLEYIMMALILPAIVLLLSEYLDKPKMRTPKHLLLISLVPLVSLVLVWTNGIHHLYYTAHALRPFGPFTIFSMSYGPAFWVFQAYTHALVIACLVMMIRVYSVTSGPHRLQMRMLLLALLMPWIANLVAQINIAPSPSMYTTIIGFLISAVLIYYTVFRHELLELMPLAMDKVVASMPDAMIVMDRNDRLMFKNPAAAMLLDSQALGYGAEFERIALRVQDGESEDVHRSEGTIHTNEGPRMFAIQISPVMSRGHTPIGTVVMMHDITSERCSQEALQNANAKLNLLSSVTRHDVMNQLTAARGYAELLRLKLERPVEARKYLDGLENALALIEKQVSFTRDYQDVGVKKPEWQNVQDVADKARRSSAVGNIEFNIDMGGVRVYADPMLEKVFYNLFDNAVRHGKRVSCIKAWSRLIGDGLEIVIEDDGAGVPEWEKSRIFDIGYGKNTGMGLFICAQVLGITGITIQENGIEGKGARFSLSVPRGCWSKASDRDEATASDDAHSGPISVRTDCPEIGADDKGRYHT